MRRKLMVLLAFTFGTLSNGKQFRCDYAYSDRAGGWLKLHRIPARWRDARLRCHLEGSNLASPLTANLASVMRSIMQYSSLSTGVYTGIHSYFSGGDFHSIEGMPLSKIPHTWAGDEPDNLKGDESCTMMLGNGHLADVNCADPLPYLCYRKLSTNNVTKCGTIDKEYRYDPRTGSCYKFHTVPRIYSRAFMACTAEGGSLAIINSETEAQVIRELFAKYPSSSMVGTFWKDVALVGFHDWGEHGEFLTIEGQTLQEAGYAKFLGGEPNNSTTGEFCGSVYRSALLNDLSCGTPHAFICEKTPDSLVVCP